ncbi:MULTISPECIES: dihydrofolate reductase [Paenibacillus]|uniref:Dihydrofolate reductase n=1 Tax=Paenibacillus albilobatus TaxID=2716884 RepID=A0A920CAR2_9BACL|nr:MULTISPECIES: dihydrofolate reductase [Paenibacillus]MDR9854122.1 dihydrofolate reductase [Paenibacillus sp. VCA1]GIO31183.1 dihydrofolate reductase [Paenibacillus albilobatus]
MSMTYILAMGKNRVIGRDNALPWRLPRDMAFFKEQTMGKKVLMGRKTWESFGAKPLPGRTNIVMTRDPQYTAAGAQVIHTVEEAVETSRGEEVMVIGGEEIYRLLMPYADRLLITEIDETFEGDTFFPEIDESEWKCIQEVQGIRDEKNPFDYRFCTYERR